jgi:hypothetical protein
MNTTIRKPDDEEQSSRQVDIDLAKDQVVSATEWVETTNGRAHLVREFNAGTIGKIIAGTLASLLLLPLIISGLIIFFKSADQAQAYASIVITLLKGMGEFMSSAFLPVLSAVLIYYFIREHREKPRN